VPLGSKPWHWVVGQFEFQQWVGSGHSLLISARRMWLFLLRRLRGAIAAAVAAVEPMGMLAAYERQDILYHCAKRFEERFEGLAMVHCIEAGKPSNLPLY